MSNKKVILIGFGSYFTDLFQSFKDKGFELICIQLTQKVDWFNNYELLKTIGFKFIHDEPTMSYIKDIELTPNTIILRGTYSGDGDQFPQEIKNICKREMEIFYEFSKKNKLNKNGAKAILCFCGDNIYKTSKYINWFSEKSKYSNLLLFDNDLIKKYVTKNIPNLASKKSIIAYFETPLLKNVYHNKSSNINTKEFISLGRNICSFSIDKYVNIIRFPIKKGIAKNIYEDIVYKIKYKTLKNFRKKLKFCLAGQKEIKVLKKDRELFFNLFQNYAFGISHIYNLFDNDISNIMKNNELFDYRCSDFINFDDYKIPQVYTVFNTASKDVTYLMNGIIPIIPHKEHSFYKMLYDKKMAIVVESINDLKKLYDIDYKEIQEYRDNIYANRDIFTFDHLGEILINSLNEIK